MKSKAVSKIKIVIVEFILSVTLTNCITIQKNDNSYYMDLMLLNSKIKLNYKNINYAYANADFLSSYAYGFKGEMAYQFLSVFDDISINNRIIYKDFYENESIKKTNRYFIRIQAEYKSLSEEQLFENKIVNFVMSLNCTMYFDNFITRDEGYLLCTESYAVNYFKLWDQILELLWEEL